MNADLLAEADSRTGVEWEEDERVRNEVFLYTFVNEPIGIKLLSCGRYYGQTMRDLHRRASVLTRRPPIFHIAMHVKDGIYQTRPRQSE